MSHSRLRKPSPAMVVALIALLAALGGTAAAAKFGPFKGDKIIKKQSLSGNRLRNQTVTGNQIKRLQWQPLTLTNGWVDYDAAATARTPAVAVDAQGIVHFRGEIKCGTGTTCTASSNQFSTLPAGFVPSQDVRLTVNAFGDYAGQMNIKTDGTLKVYSDPQAGSPDADIQARTSLDGLTYALG